MVLFKGKWNEAAARGSRRIIRNLLVPILRLLSESFGSRALAVTLVVFNSNRPYKIDDLNVQIQNIALIFFPPFSLDISFRNATSRLPPQVRDKWLVFGISLRTSIHPTRYSGVAGGEESNIDILDYGLLMCVVVLILSQSCHELSGSPRCHWHILPYRRVKSDVP